MCPQLGQSDSLAGIRSRREGQMAESPDGAASGVGPELLTTARLLLPVLSQPCLFSRQGDQELLTSCMTTPWCSLSPGIRTEDVFRRKHPSRIGRETGRERSQLQLLPIMGQLYGGDGIKTRVAWLRAGAGEAHASLPCLSPALPLLSAVPQGLRSGGFTETWVCSQGRLGAGAGKADPCSQGGTTEPAERHQGTFHQEEALGSQQEGGAKEASHTPEGNTGTPSQMPPQGTANFQGERRSSG
ncbi:hypothetical protein Cadr_000017363 [Camelus dromedarius]|uniref:Uncharacterized protein n=1 Tax=Camelus dromedarius TaxID=9838 RepID=A0A5N4DGW0_CAMDR|nr:hypothetical protein Cadr_000017363 [Camelus dromedarius]